MKLEYSRELSRREADESREVEDGAESGGAGAAEEDSAAEGETGRRRGFEIAKGWEEKEIRLPRRSTANSAGYDIEAAENITIPPFKLGRRPAMIPTGLKAYCQPDECYLILNRSSGPRRGLVLANGVGLIDADYYNNTDNDGHFRILAYNISDKPLEIKKGERVAQVVFQKFLRVDDDRAGGERKGGIGSTS